MRRKYCKHRRHATVVLLAAITGLSSPTGGAENPLAAPSAESPTRPPRHPASIGLGLGVPYGMLGVNADYLHGAGVVEGTLGVGGFVFTGLTRNVGVRAYLAGNGQGWRLSAHYGTNALVADWFTFNAYDGLSFGVGWRGRFGQSTWGLDTDLIYIATSDADRYFANMQQAERRAGKFTLSIGARHFFDAW